MDAKRGLFFKVIPVPHNLGVGSQTAQIQLAILGIGRDPLDIATIKRLGQAPSLFVEIMNA